MHQPDDVTRYAAERRVRQGARALGLSTREYVAEASRRSHHHDADLHAVGALRAADREGREMTAGELARELSLSPAAASALIDRMERAGHVVRGRSPRDGRRVTLAATPSAHATSGEMFGPLVEAYDTALAPFTPEQIAMAADILDRLADATARATPPTPTLDERGSGSAGGEAP